MTATKQAAKPVPVTGPCTRYPCDHAYRLWAHKPGEDGEVTHTTHVDGSDSQGWEVALLAFGDGDWRVAVDVDGSGFTAIYPESLQEIGESRDSTRRASNDALKNAIELSNAIAKAAAYMAATL
ncbi:hypothetical protein BH10ACT8_BH10ACT8_11170 [soil metagenome]